MMPAEDTASLLPPKPLQRDPSKRKPLPDVEVLQRLLAYDPSTGLLTWRAREGDKRFNKMYAGKVAGSLAPDGYRKVKIEQTIYWCHRVVWKLVHGNDPDVIDHINGDGLDNRIENLRDVSRVENNQNIRRDPKSGYVGVRFCPRDKRWTASISINNKRVFLGQFVLKSEAVAARKGAEKAIGYFSFDRRPTGFERVPA